MKKIVLTGGGTAGHVTPNLALLPALQNAGYEVTYIGSYDGIEKRLIGDFDIPYVGISTGKFRRYFDVKNFTDPFRVIKGFCEARKFLKTHMPVCCNFPETLKLLPPEKSVLTGSPIRAELSQGNKLAGLDLCGFTANKPVIMVIGGSLGAANVNKAVRDALPVLLKDFQIVHLCGKGKIDNLLLNTPGYKQFEYIKTELKDLFAMADIVISRAGANAICELLALKKPNILIPLPAESSRGDQLLNAASFEAQGFSMVIQEEDLTTDLLAARVQELYFTRQSYHDAMSKSGQMDSIQTILKLIEEVQTNQKQ